MLKILVVDDNPDNVELLCQLLEDEHDTIRAYGGEEGLRLARSEQPDLILLDILMPGMDGYAVMAKLQDDDRTRAIPVIYLTAWYKETDRVVRGLDLGAFDYIVKPVADEILMAKIRVVQRLKQAEKEKIGLIKRLEQALAEIKKLSGLLPICSSCKKIRDDKGYWQHVETYIRTHSEAEFSHGICPRCAQILYPDFTENDKTPGHGG